MSFMTEDWCMAIIGDQWRSHQNYVFEMAIEQLRTL